VSPSSSSCVHEPIEQEMRSNRGGVDHVSSGPSSIHPPTPAALRSVLAHGACCRGRLPDPGTSAGLCACGVTPQVTKSPLLALTSIYQLKTLPLQVNTTTVLVISNCRVRLLFYPLKCSRLEARKLNLLSVPFVRQAINYGRGMNMKQAPG